MPISHALKCIFIHVPKAGGSSIAQILSEKSGHRLDLWGRIHQPDRERLGLSKAWEVDHPERLQRLYHHLTWDQVKLVTGDDMWNAYTKFCVVRNPWDRLVSFYEYSRQTGQRGGTEGRSFEEWFAYRKFFPKMNPYFASRENKSMMNYIIRYENFKEETTSMFEQIGLKVELIDLPHVKKSLRQPYQHYYTQAMAEELYLHLKDEIEMFNYSF